MALTEVWGLTKLKTAPSNKGNQHRGKKLNFTDSN